MEYTFFNKKDSRGLLNNLFSINIQTIPFQSIIIPTGFPAIAYIYMEINRPLFIIIKQQI